MAPAALLGWECGRGLGHAIPLIRIAQELKSRGWRCVLALRADLIPEGFRVEGVEVRAAPLWETDTEARRVAPRSSASMAGVLAGIGLSSRERVEKQIGAWRDLLAEHDPDLVVTDYAPGAVLAARGRVPCLATGNGYTVPPDDLEVFPPFHSLEAHEVSEPEILDAVNAALAAHDTRPLRALSQALTGDASCLCTLPFLDPYLEKRHAEAVGPLLRESVTPSREDADEIFCYLREAPGEERLTALVAAIAGLPQKTVAFLPGLPEARRAWLRERGVTVLETLASLNEQLSRTCLLVHAGGHGMSAAAVLAGVPQVVTSFDVEKWLTAKRLVNRGIALQLDYQGTDASHLRAAIASVFDDPVIRLEARRACEEHAAFRDRDVAKIVADAGERLTSSAQ